MTAAEDALATIVANLQQRVEAMERASQLNHSSVVDDEGKVYDARTGIIAGHQAATDAAQALQQLASVEAITDGKVTVFYNAANDPPTEERDNPEYQDIWMREGVGGQYDMLTYDGDTWLVIQNQQNAAQALIAAQNAQDTADRKIETYWQGADPTQTANPITPSSGDLWYQTALGSDGTTVVVIGVYRWDVTISPGWQQLPLATGALAQGGIDPSRLTVGVVTNLAQDPDFRTNLRTPPLRPNGVSDWTILGPDAAYPTSNYMRCQNRTPGQVGSSNADSTWRITGRIPVDAGRTVRIACLMRASQSAETTTPAPVLGRVRVYWLKTSDPDDATGYSPFGFYRNVDIAAEFDAPDTWYPVEGNFRVPEGYSSFVAAFETTFQTAGSIDFIRPEVQVPSSVVRSGDYIEGEQGWALDVEKSEFGDVNVRGSLGADTLSSRRMVLDGLDMRSEVLYMLPRGIIAQGGRSNPTHAGNTSGTTELILWQFNIGAVETARTYRIHCKFLWQGSVNGDGYDFRMRAAAGATPTLTSPELIGSLQRMTSQGTIGEDMHLMFLHSPTLDSPDYRLILTGRRISGTGYGWMYQQTGDGPRRFEWSVEDVGVDRSSSLALAQRAVGGGFGAPGGGTLDPEPVQTYQREWVATWSRSYDADGTIRAGDPTDLYQGYGDATGGNSRSLFGFDYAAIQAALAGATIDACTISYRVRGAGSATGVELHLCSHNYTTRPATWAAVSVVADVAVLPGRKAGEPYVHNLGVTVGNQFKSGTTRGLGFGPAPGNNTLAYFAYMYGAGSLSAPRLSIRFRK